MEGGVQGEGQEFPAAKQLSEFCHRVFKFLNQLSDEVGDGRYLKRLESEFALLERQGELGPAGLTGEQLDFKVGLAIRDMVRVVLGSLKGLSKWVEALIEFVEMTEKALGEP